MSKLIRIGTRDSELAMWQAKTVEAQLNHLGYSTTIVAVKSTGDIVLNQPIYEIGITGVFTRTLDIALLNEEIDIAVHSLKDVPTVLPSGIVQAAVLKRGNVRDTLVYKTNEEFLAQPNAVVATGSLRRKAQWLNRYPKHQIVGLRGNINTRLKRLEDNPWDGAIFAAAGLGRIGLTPKNAINLEWMVPAPAQGAVMIATLENSQEILEICAEINHTETELCTTLERQFLNKLEGGCSAPIGALAFIKNEEVHFHGIILSEDGTQKIEVKRSQKLEKHHAIVEECVEFIISRGGKNLVGQKVIDKNLPIIVSSKTLSQGQKNLFIDRLQVNSSDFIKTTPNRIKPQLLKANHSNVIITSKNAVEAILNNCSKEELNFETIYCVGRRTKRLVEQKIGPVKHTAKNAKALANHLVEFLEGTEVSYFCSDIRLDILPSILTEHHIQVKEIEAYSTKLTAPSIDDSVEGVMFYSPSTVHSFVKNNAPSCIAYCIGETTANTAKDYFKEVRVAKIPTVESVIELVNENYLSN
jgi:hydroxymethylbilane synthase